jgi:hypothetical protein
VSAEVLGPQWWGASVLVLTAVIVATMARVIVVVGLSSLLLPPTPTGVQSVTCVAVVADLVMY